MSRQKPERAPRAFGHPLFWGSLALLLANDHLFKGAGVLPGWITGKASDFAGLLIAPALLSQALPYASPGGRARVASGAVALVFAAINLFAPASELALSALSLLGIGGRLWVDPTDLVALAVMPIAYRLCLPVVAPRAPPGATRGFSLGALRGRLALTVGALACLASAGLDDDDEGSGTSRAPQVVNETGQPLMLIVASTEGVGGCELYRERHARSLTTDAFGVQREVALEDGARALLVADADAGSCGAAWLTLPDGSETFLSWHDLVALEGYVAETDKRRRDRRVVIEGSLNRYRVVLGDDLEEFEPGTEPEPPTCEEQNVRHALSWTSPTFGPGFIELAEVDEVDGCLEVAWALPDDAPSQDAGLVVPERLCIPGWAFPFDPGDVLSVIEQPIASGGRRLRITRYDGDRLDQQLEIFQDASDFEGSLVRSAEPLECFGRLTACGAYERPLSLEVWGQDERLEAGDQATLEAGDAEETRLLVGEARDIGWTSAACEGAEARVGPSLDLLELRNY